MNPSTFRLEIVSPVSAVFNGTASLVEIPGSEGDFGVLAGHAPFFSMLRPGVISVHRDGESTKRYFATSGYADVSPDATMVLSDHIQDLDTVSSEAADEALAEADRALAEAVTPDDKSKAEKQREAAAALLRAIKA